MNKFQFIKHLMETRKFTPSQKERFLKLASKEIGLIKPSNEELWEEIKRIKRKIGDENPDSNPAEIRFRGNKLFDLDKMDVAALLAGSDPVANIEELNENQERDVDKSLNAILSKNKLIENKDKVSIKYLKNRKKYHNPKKVNEWLLYFTRDNTAIKFSTHPWDDYLYTTYEDYISELNDEFNKYDFHSLQEYNADLYWNKIYPFLFQKRLTKLEISGKKPFGWGRYKIGLGWQYPNFIKLFCEHNFDDMGMKATTPLTMILPKEIMPDIPGKTIKTFEEVVNVFKQEIEFRDNTLWVGVKSALLRELPNHQVEGAILDKLKGCTFYTNTEYVLKAISRIFTMIKSRSESQKVEISCSFSEDTHQYILEILHLNSYSNLHIHHPKLIAVERGDLSILRTTLLSLCDFSIESQFKDEEGNAVNARIDYLYDDVDTKDWEPKIITDIENPGGFKFILKFLA